MDSPNYAKAFETILRECVSADDSTDITVIYDEYFEKYFPAFSEVVNRNSYEVTYIFMPDSYQAVLQNNNQFYNDDEIQLPKGVKAAINRSAIVLNFLTGSSKSSKVRGAVLTYIKANGCKVIHCPHISDEVLDLILISSFEQVHSACELVAWALGNSELLTVKTTGPKGEKLELNIKLDRWGNDPFISSGIIPENSWGNVTPGEAFCCPKLSNVNGSICINGSVPGYIFNQDEYLLLTFTKGKITHWETNSGSRIGGYFNSLISNAEKLNDQHWDSFAEFGIGLNPKIKSLTGNALFDEKMAGTIHIAIGDNLVFGHQIQSHIHEDMIITNATVLFDQKVVIDKGKLKKAVLKEWREEFVPAMLDIAEGIIISFKQAKVHFEDNKVKRKLNKGNRVGYLDIFKNSKQHKQATVLKEFFGDDDLDHISWADLIKKTKKHLDTGALRHVIEIFHHYKMVSLK